MILKDIDEKAGKQVGGAPYLSYSRVSRYLLCPEQYRLYYVENLKPKVASANLVFGQVIHEALSELFGKAGDPLKLFHNQWQLLKEVELDYRKKDSWEKLKAVGQALLLEFLKKEVMRFDAVLASEKAFKFKVTGLDLWFVGIIDLVAEINGAKTVVDFKTSAASYQPYEVRLSDQLTAYQLAEPEAKQSALCVLVKTQTPKIEWHQGSRGPAETLEFLRKVNFIAQEILSESFYQRSGKWCSYCDYLSLCLKDTAKAKQTLVCAA